MEKPVPYELCLPVALKNACWKVKIRDKETCEPPHVTIIQKMKAWRINLRTGEFMDACPEPSAVPSALKQIMKCHWILLCQQWDAMYPNNPVADHEV
jgi:hypothetical protein